MSLLEASTSHVAGGRMRGASQSDKEDRLSWELPGFFNKYLVKVCDESGTTLGAVVTTENKVEKKKIHPGVVGTLLF